METAVCGNCGEKPVSEFYEHHTRGYQDKCKKCKAAYNREHYKKNSESYKRRSRKQNTEIRKQIRELTQKKKDVPCADCGVKYPYFVMDFDHVKGEKEFTIASSVKSGKRKIKEVLAEIEKCEVVCANCHRFRTQSRATRQRAESSPKRFVSGAAPE